MSDLIHIEIHDHEILRKSKFLLCYQTQAQQGIEISIIFLWGLNTTIKNLKYLGITLGWLWLF